MDTNGHQFLEKEGTTDNTDVWGAPAAAGWFWRLAETIFFFTEGNEGNERFR
jgi:hypothetical protein